ncbi:MAG: hypothetical protein EHJ95_04375 [Methanobacteriota archaeon]|nr:MAG: hypothetical protein EHJ95_04375 [Euryarchaeota archaeon]
MKADDQADAPPWYKTAVIYGLDVALFFDADGDGTGDLRGIIAKLDYLADLGITCIWLLPFFPSPDRDNGYDVANFIDVDPRAGNLRDFRNLVHLAEERGIRILIDLVVHHTSDTHPWFYASCADRTSRYGDYYIWTEQHPGSCCQSPGFPIVSTDVWKYEESARAFYHHYFYYFQPDLNFANPAVREEVAKIIEFWLAFGIAGFRLDALNHIFAGKDLPGTSLEPDGYLEELHRLIEAHRPDAVFVAEADVAPDAFKTYFGDGNRIQMLFNFLVDKAFFLAIARQKAEPLADLLRSLRSPLLRGSSWRFSGTSTNSTSNG